MTTMLEKAQTAIASYCAPLGISTIREERLAIARAALQAIREPDEAMVHAGWVGADDGGQYEQPGQYAVTAAFTAMIDAILNEKPEGEA